MTEESNQPVDKSNHPPYPDDLQGRQLAPLDETKIPVSKLWNSGYVKTHLRSNGFLYLDF